MAEGIKDGPRRNWRPENWWSPYGWKDWHDWEAQGATKPITVHKAEAYEEGANAMLEALKSKASYMTPQQMRLLAPDRQYPYGHLIFIPDEILGPLPDGPEHMTMEQFIHCVEIGGFIDDDGHGRYATATHELKDPYICISPSMVHNGTIDKSWTHIVWYNR